MYSKHSSKEYEKYIDFLIENFNANRLCVAQIDGLWFTFILPHHKGLVEAKNLLSRIITSVHEAKKQLGICLA